MKLLDCRYKKFEKKSRLLFEAPLKPGENLSEGQKPPENPLKPENSKEKEGLAHGSARVKEQQFMSNEGLDALQKIQKRQEEIGEEQKKLQATAKTQRAIETWVGEKPEAIPQMPIDALDPSKRVDKAVEEKFQEYREQFEKAGLGDETNTKILKETAKNLILEHFSKTGLNKDATLDYVKNVLSEKLTNLIGGLQNIYDSHQHPFNKPTEVLEAFSDFTGLGFIKNGILQPNEFDKTLKLERSDYESTLASFKKFLGLNLETKQLEGQKTDLLGKKIGPEQLLREKRITLPEIRFAMPKDPKDLDKNLAAAIGNALESTKDEEVKQKMTGYLIAELKKLNPQPEETFIISPDGKWSKIDTKKEAETKAAAEQQAKEEAQTQLADVEKQKAEQPQGSFADTLKAIFKNLSEVFKDFMSYILDLFKSFSSKLGGKDPLETLMKEWKDATDAEKNGVKGFMEAMKKYSLRTDNLNSLIKNPNEMRRVLAAKKNEPWDKWLQEHLDEKKRQQINSSNMNAKAIADLLISVNKPD